MLEKEYKEKSIEVTKRVREISNMWLGNLADDYAESNNPVKVHDLVIDKHIIIKVVNIYTILDEASNLPACSYHGLRISRDGTCYKNRSTGIVLQPEMLDYINCDRRSKKNITKELQTKIGRHRQSIKNNKKP
jgi:hypothetical protein